MFYQLDESDALRNTIILDRKRSAIMRLQSEKETSIPKFTLSNLLNSSNVEYSRLYAFSSHCSEEEFMKIRNWQSDAVITIIECEYKVMQRIIRQACHQGAETASVLNSLKAAFDTLYDTDENTPIDEVIRRAKQLILFQHPNYSFGNINSWVDELRLFQDGKLNHDNVIPLITRALLKEYRKNPKYPISGTPFLWLALQRIESWIDKIISGSININQDLPTDFSQLYYQAVEEGTNTANELIEQFSNGNNPTVQTNEQYREALYDRLDELRHKAKTEAFRVYYLHISDEQQTKKIFQHNCFFSDDYEKEKQSFTEIISIYEEVNWLSGEIRDIDGKPPFNRAPIIDGDRTTSGYSEFNFCTRHISRQT